MSADYDVIVIGAGNGGLASAALTAKNGLKTLLVEKHNIPGGSATSFRRGRFEFETSLHELCTVGTAENPGGMYKLFQMLGADVEWATGMDETFRIICPPEGVDVTMPCGIENFVGALEKEVPGSAPSMVQMFKLAGMCSQALAAMDEPGATMETVEEKFPDFFKYAGHSITDVLDSLGMPKKAQRIVTTYWAYLGANADVLDFAIYARMLAGYVIYGAGMSRYRSHEISLALDKVIRDNGGEIWYNTEITEILVKNGKACGVKIGDREYHGDSVVSSSYPDLVYGSMIDSKEVPERGVKLMNSREIGLSFITVYLGMNKSIEELGIDTYSNFIMPTTDSVQLQKNSTGTHDYSGYVIMNCLNKLIPDCTPEGTCQLFFTTLYYGGWDDVTDPEEYRKLKNETAMKMIRDCEKAMGISIMPYIEEIVIAGPPTFARYLNTPEGTPYGYQVTKTDSFIQRQVEAKNEQYIEDLYFVGAASKRGDGYSSTYLSGIDAGKAILAKAREKGGLVR
ncbi:phytoene desaturase family protein [Baileyella intestinalis]|uniref:phytoene desaturase family protein n=1 Tax=Baileyella intestinalis TaxID=2606709 RepID=UPI003A86355E